MSAAPMSFEDFTRFRHKYSAQIEKLERKIQYFLFRNRNFIKEDPFLEDVFLESILVDVRALLMENERYHKNYTVQNSFKINSTGDEDDVFFQIASKIDEYVNNTILPDGQTSFYEAVKFYTDKYVAHRDGTTPDDDKKRDKIKSYFLDDQNFSLAQIIQAIIDTTEEIDEKLIYGTLEAFTAVSDGVELEDPNSTEPKYSLEEDSNSSQCRLDDQLTKEILKKSFKDIAYLIGLDVQGIQPSELDAKALEKRVSNYVQGLRQTKKMKFVLKVHELPNQ